MPESEIHCWLLAPAGGLGTAFEYSNVKEVTTEDELLKVTSTVLDSSVVHTALRVQGEATDPAPMTGGEVVFSRVTVIASNPVVPSASE